MAAFTVQGVLSLLTEQADNALKQTAENAEKQAGKIEEKFAKLGSVLKKALTVAAVVKFGKALYNLAQETANYGDTVDKASQKLGISRQAYQEWDYILSQNGASVSSLTTAMRSMNNVMQDSGKANAALKKMGLTMSQLTGKTQEQQFEMIVTALAGMENETERNAAAAAIFGRSYQELLPLLNSGVESIEELRQRAHQLGIVMDDETIDAAVNFTDNLDNLRRTWNSLKMVIGAQLLKPLTKAFQTLTGWVSRLIPSLKQAFNTGEWSGFFSDITDIMSEALPQVVDTIIGMVTGIFDNADKLVDLAMAIIEGLADGLAKAVPTLISKLPQIFNSVVGSIGRIISNLFTGDGITNIIDSLLQALGFNETTRESIKQVFQTAFGGFYDIYNSIKDAVTGIWSSIVSWLNGEDNGDGAKTNIGNVFSTAFSYILNIESTIEGALTNVWNTILTALGVPPETAEAITGLFDTQFEHWLNFKSRLGNTFSGIWTNIAGFLKGDTSGQGMIRGCFEAVFGETGIVGGYWKDLKTSISNAWTNLQNFFAGNNPDGTPLTGAAEDFWKTFVKPINDAIEWISGTVGTVTTAVSEFIEGTGIPTAVKDTWDGFVSGIGDAFNSIGQWLTDAWTTITNFLQGLDKDGNPLPDPLYGIIKLFQPIIDVIDTINGAAASAINWIGSLFGLGGEQHVYTEQEVNVFKQGAVETQVVPVVDTEGAQEQLDKAGLTARVKLSFFNALGEWGGYEIADGLDMLLHGHATGLDYVPFDNYVGRLHRGEAVLSAFEAAQWRERGQIGAGNNYTDNNTLYVGQMYMGNELDAAQLQQTLEIITRRRNRGYGL